MIFVAFVSDADVGFNTGVMDNKRVSRDNDGYATLFCLMNLYEKGVCAYTWLSFAFGVNPMVGRN
jgi:hypothetical protein